MSLYDAMQSWVRRRLVARGVASVIEPVDGHPMHRYVVSGSGRGTVVLVHGLGGSANGFSRVLLPLARHFREVVALDLPGNGFSPLPREGPLHLGAQAELLVAFLRACSEPVFLVGNSLGGGMALMAASEAPERVSALGLVAPAGAKIPSESLTKLLSTFRVGSIADARALTRKLFHRTPILALLFAGELRNVYRSPAVASVFDEALELGGLEPEVFSKLTMPILLLWGESDRILPSEMLASFRKSLPPHAVIEVVKGFGHVPQVERPARLVERLVAFRDESAPPVSG